VRAAGLAGRRRRGDRIERPRREVQNETSPPTISASDRGRCRAAGYLAPQSRARTRCRTFQPWPGYESSGYFGFGAPAKTPAEIVDKLNQEINAGLADPKLKAQLADLGGIILGGSAGDFRTLIAEEIEKWAKVIQAANIKAE